MTDLTLRLALGIVIIWILAFWAFDRYRKRKPKAGTLVLCVHDQQAAGDGPHDRDGFWE